MKNKNILNFEESLLQQHQINCNLIAGADEVGRGCLAGPMVSCLVAIDMRQNHTYLKDLGINDSKKISATKRKKIYDFIINEKPKGLQFFFNMQSAEIIDKINILQATKLSFYRLIEDFTCDISTDCFFFLDGNMNIDNIYADLHKAGRKAVITKDVNYISVVGGDGKSVLIGLAPIMAKVFRDNLMKKAAQQYPGFDLENNAGYGTAKHRAGIMKHGLTPLHRRSFCKKIYLTLLPV